MRAGQEHVVEPLTFHQPEGAPESDAFSVLRFRGWEVAFKRGTLMISNNDGFRVAVKDVCPTRARVVVSSDEMLQVFVYPFSIEIQIHDESVRDWIVRFLHYWGFSLEGVRVECGVILRQFACSL